jgi:membrane dipeptidase
MMDVSHPSRESNMWVMANSKAPVIASHSAVRALCPTASRDLDDEQLLALRKNGGVMQTVAFSSYLVCTPATSHERTAALEALARQYDLPIAVVTRGNSSGPGARTSVVRSAACSIGDPPAEPQRDARPARANPVDAMDEATRTRYQSARDAIDVTYPAPVPARRANVSDLANHIDYAVRLIGIDHVGISSDFDGGGIDGFNCAAEAPNVTIELVRRGYTEEQIAKLWGGNLLRVMEQTERVARQLQAAS